MKLTERIYKSILGIVIDIIVIRSQLKNKRHIQQPGSSKAEKTNQQWERRKNSC